MSDDNLQETLAKTEEVIAEKEEAVSLGEALERLKENPDYKKVIIDHMIEAKSEELFKILTDPSGASPYSEEQIKLQLAVISYIKRQLGTDTYQAEILSSASSAKAQIDINRAFRKEITAEYSQLQD